MKMKQPFKVVGPDSAMMVDISDEACMRFSGFRHGTRIIDPDGDEGTIMGVAPAEDSEAEVLWYRLEKNGDLVYWDEVTDLVDEGFKVFGEPVKELSEKVVYALRSRVVGKAGAAGEDAVIVRNEVVWEQYEAFKEAGYTDIRFEAVRVLIDEDNNEYLIKKLMPLDDPAASTVIPARYRAEHINPGINVYDYDRDVLKRGITWSEAILASIIGMAIALASLGMLGLIMVKVITETKPQYAPWIILAFATYCMVASSRWINFSMGVGRRCVGFPPIKE